MISFMKFRLLFVTTLIKSTSLRNVPLNYFTSVKPIYPDVLVCDLLATLKVICRILKAYEINVFNKKKMTKSLYSF